jgi:site-specific DNA-cytosine methylase
VLYIDIGDKNMKKANKNFKTRDVEGKTTAITATYYKTPMDGNYLQEGFRIRKLTPIECERLQSLPDNYTEGVSNTQRYKALGNAFNCEVIKHIIKVIHR